MKTSGWVATAVGAVVLVGGGIWGVNALTNEPETAYTGAYEPAIAETPEPVETDIVEPDESVEPAYSAEEETWLSYRVSLHNTFDAVEYLSDEEFIAMGRQVCADYEAGTPYEEISIWPDNWQLNETTVAEAAIVFCPDVYQAEIGGLY